MGVGLALMLVGTALLTFVIVGVLENSYALSLGGYALSLAGFIAGIFGVLRYFQAKKREME